MIGRWSGLAAAVIALGACAGDSVPAGDAPADTTAADASRPAEEWRIGVAGGGGMIGPTTSRAELARLFDGAVTDTSIHVGEGQFEPGTVVHAGDPLRRAEIVWRDSTRTLPWRVQVAGDSTRWTVGPGITLGTTLAELERLNGRPLPITGFGWDYGGTIMGWDEGSLEQALLGGNGRVILRLAPDSTAAAADTRPVSGDAIFRSDDPAMRRLDPSVRLIIVEYDTPPSAP